MSRTKKKHLELLEKGSNCQGCICQPAIPFEAEQCPPDMLQMKKGIIMKLVNQVVDWAIVQNREEALLFEIKRHKIPYVYVLSVNKILKNINLV